MDEEQCKKLAKLKESFELGLIPSKELYEAAVAKELGIIHQGTNNNTYCIVGFW
jgi:hypothetical protein